jgi:hypothetical protein
LERVLQVLDKDRGRGGINVLSKVKDRVVPVSPFYPSRPVQKDSAVCGERVADGRLEYAGWVWCRKWAGFSCSAACSVPFLWRI